MDNAFEKARAAYGSGAYDDATLEFLFPQLKESEDERIRKRIKLCLDECVHSDIIRDYERDECLAYLEKQKEQKPAEWSEEDEKKLMAVISLMKTSRAVDPFYDKMCLESWLKSLRPQWRPSEEQMEALKNSAYGTYQNGDGPALRELYEQLKKLGVKEEPEYYQHFDPDC